MTPTESPRRWWSLAVLALGLSVIILDGTIVGVALPSIITDLELDLSTAQWVNSLYSVVFAALLLSSGALGDRIGRRTAFLAGLAFFFVGSLLAASSDSGSALIAARAVQGVGGALILPATLSTVNAQFRGAERAAAFGVWGAVMAGAAAIGPLLGGWLTDAFAWEWVFIINLPLCVLIFIGALLVVPNTRAEHAASGIDIGGPVLSAIGFGCLVFGIIEGPDIGWFTPTGDLEIMGFTWSQDAWVSAAFVALVVSVVALASFVGWERHRANRGRSTILELSLFTIPTFSWGNITAAMVAVGEFSLVFVLPLLLVNAMGYSTLEAGYVLSAMALGAFVSGALARHAAERFGPPRVVIIGLSLEAAGVAAIAVSLGVEATVWLIAPLLIGYGLGLGLASAQLTSTVLVDVPVELSGQGSATQSTARQVGSALGTALAGLGLSMSLAGTERSQLEALGASPEQAAQLADATSNSAGSIIPQIASGQIPQIPQPQAVADALSEGFIQSTQVALVITTVFLLLGLLGAFRVARVARVAEGETSPSESASHAGDGAHPRTLGS